jgi:hypothetical protein
VIEEACANRKTVHDHDAFSPAIALKNACTNCPAGATLHASCIIDPKAFSSLYWILDRGRTRVSLNVLVSNLLKLPSRRIAQGVDRLVRPLDNILH